jgi:uncharacterized protein VirK/YbjX
VTDNAVLRAKFLFAAVWNLELAERLCNADESTPFGRFVLNNPDTAVNLLQPYQCAAWDARERFDRIEQHANAMERLGLAIGPGEKLLLADLGFLSKDASLLLDQPPWLEREGHLTLNLFKGTFRAFSVSFSLADTQEQNLFIGSLQGRDVERALDLYRSLTKEFHGVRPRDLIIEMLRLFAQKVGVQRIFAVADDYRIATHRYFGARQPDLSYNRVWEERGGWKVDETQFELPLEIQRRDLDEVGSKKRNMYKQRYAMFDAISDALPLELSDARRLSFEAI